MVDTVWVFMTLLFAAVIALNGSVPFSRRNGPILPDRPVVKQVPVFFFKALPPEIRNMIYQEVFGDLLHLWPMNPKPKRNFALALMSSIAGLMFTPRNVQTPSWKLASLTVSKQWKAEIQSVLEANTAYDLRNDHRSTFLLRELVFPRIKDARYLVISHLATAEFPFQHMPNLICCVIRRIYSKDWLNPLMDSIPRQGGGLTISNHLVQSFTHNPVESLMHIDVSRFMEMWKKIQKQTTLAGTNPDFLVQGIWRAREQNHFDNDTVSHVPHHLDDKHLD